MEGNEVKKIRLSTAVCIFVIVILLAICVALYYFGYVEKSPSKTDSVEVKSANKLITFYTVNTAGENVSDKKNNEEKVDLTKSNIAKVDESKDWVYSEKKKYGNIPHVNINSESAKIINEDILNEYNDVEDREKRYSQESGNSSEGYNAYSYNCYTNGDYISLVVEILGSEDSKNYTVYNINKATGNYVSNLELISSRGLTKSEFLEKFRGAATQKYAEYKSRATSSEYRSLGETINSTNDSIDAPLFLGKDGKIDSIVRETTFAGASFYYFIVDVE